MLGILTYAFGDDVLGWTPPETAALYDFATFVPFWVLGYGVQLGWFDRLGRRGYAALALVTGVVAALYLRANALPDNDPDASNIALFFLGMPWLFGLYALRAPLARSRTRAGAVGHRLHRAAGAHHLPVAPHRVGERLRHRRAPGLGAHARS